MKVTSKATVGHVVIPLRIRLKLPRFWTKPIIVVVSRRPLSNAISSRIKEKCYALHFKTSTKSGVSREGKLNICEVAGSKRLGKSSANAHVGLALVK